MGYGKHGALAGRADQPDEHGLNDHAIGDQ